MSQQGGSLASDIGVLHRWLVATCAVLVVVLAVGYALGIEAITRIQPTWPVIYPYTVVGLAALVVAMILFDRGGRTGLFIGRALAAIPLLFGVVVEPAISLGLLPSSDPVADDYTLVTALPAPGRGPLLLQPHQHRVLPATQPPGATVRPAAVAG